MPNHIVPFAEKLHEKRRKILGLDKLSYIDEGIYFNEGNPVPIVKDKELLEAGRKMYNELSPETKEFYNFLLDNEMSEIREEIKEAQFYFSDKKKNIN